VAPIFRNDIENDFAIVMLNVLSTDAFAARAVRPVAAPGLDTAVSGSAVEVDAAAVAGNKARHLKGDTLLAGLNIYFNACKLTECVTLLSFNRLLKYV
jgi:hypothetical protein